MASQGFIIRLQTSQGMVRLNFDSSNPTFKEFQKKIEEKYGVKPQEQILSYQPPSTSPSFISARPDDTLKSIKLEHGSIVYLVLGDNHVQQYNEKQNNLPNDTKSAPVKSKSVTLATSEWVNNPIHNKESNEPKHVSFHEWIQARQKQFAHQPWNIDPPKYDYKAIALTENKIKFSQLPPNAVIKRQEYRHVDVISFLDSTHLFKFKQTWEQDPTIQRAAHLIGRYEMVEVKGSVDKKRMQANVYTIYEPPQKGDQRSVKLLKDPNEQLVDKVIEACGMERVGWVITTLPRGGKEYHGDIFMSCDEIYTAARLQSKYKNPNTGYSRFISLILHVGDKEPQAFMISDQGVAMMQASLIGPSDDPGFMEVKVPPPKVYLPSVINENKEIKPGEKFLPDALLVNVVAARAERPNPIFEFIHFPANGTLDHLRKHLVYHKDKEFHIALSDFNLLCFLPRYIDIGLVQKIAKAVVTKTRLDEETRKQVSQSLSKYK